MIKRWGWSVTNLLFTGLFVFQGVQSVKSSKWGWVVFFSVFLIFSVIVTIRDWPKLKSDENHNKTNDLRKSWKDKIGD